MSWRKLLYPGLDFDSDFGLAAFAAAVRLPPFVPVERGPMRSAVAEFDVVGAREATKAPPKRKLVVPKFHETSPASTEVQRRSIKRSH